MKGWLKTSFIDYPGHIASTFFYGACNFRCPYCHNGELVDRYKYLLDISEEEAKKRLLGRRLCSNCKKVFASNFEGDFCDDCGSKLIKRSDDNEEAILKRIENFEKETMPVIKKYEEEGLLLRINGMQSIDEVSHEIENVLTSL